MDPALKARLTSSDLWMRLLYMILFTVAYGLAELVMTVAVIFQFFFILLSGSANEPLLRLGQNLTRYIADIVRFLTFNTEDRPFPFADWPDEPAGGERWQDGGAQESPGPSAPSGSSGSSGSSGPSGPSGPSEPTDPRL